MKSSDPSSDPSPPTEAATVRRNPAEAPDDRSPTLPTSETITTYDLGNVIGRGGMGELVLAHDREIGRDVAIKRLRTEDPTEDALNRFLREARIQARLDYPAIVPVYELGHDTAGRPYFTMKRLAGVTLAQLLAGQAPPRQRSLRAFAEVCFAVDFAHARAIIHRDLKPANVMLGAYGEVYVLPSRSIRNRRTPPGSSARCCSNRRHSLRRSYWPRCASPTRARSADTRNRRHARSPRSSCSRRSWCGTASRAGGSSQRWPGSRSCSPPWRR